jgi:hypothetical protein
LNHHIEVPKEAEEEAGAALRFATGVGGRLGEE